MKFVENYKTIIYISAAITGALLFRNLFLKNTRMKNWFDPSTIWYNDGVSKNKIEKLHPKFRNLVAELFTRAEKELELTLYATSGYRTYAEQVILHNQNSSNAVPGYSSHNFGFAIDLNVRKNGKAILLKASSNEAWKKSGIVDLAKSIGINWVGNYGSYHDPVHFFLKPGGLSTTELRNLYNAGKKDSQGYVIV